MKVNLIFAMRRTRASLLLRVGTLLGVIIATCWIEEAAAAGKESKGKKSIAAGEPAGIPIPSPKGRKAVGQPAPIPVPVPKPKHEKQGKAGIFETQPKHGKHHHKPISVPTHKHKKNPKATSAPVQNGRRMEGPKPKRAGPKGRALRARTPRGRGRKVTTRRRWQERRTKYGKR